MSPYKFPTWSRRLALLKLDPFELYDACRQADHDASIALARRQVQSARVVDDLITELGLGRIRRVAFVVLSESAWTLPLYEVAITTARRGWSIGIADARYWFVTSEPVPLAGFGSAARAAVSARLEPEGITFIGSTFADLRPNVVLLDPQGELLQVDRVVTLSDTEATSWSAAGGDHGTRSHSRPAATRRFDDAPRDLARRI